MGLFRGNDQRDRDLRSVQQEVTTPSTKNGFHYQISIIHFPQKLKAVSTFTFQKKKKKVGGGSLSLFCKSFEMYICCSTNMHFNWRRTVLSIDHSKLKVFFVSLLLEISALFRHQVIITGEQHTLVRMNYSKAITSHTHCLYFLKIVISQMSIIL